MGITGHRVSQLVAKADREAARNKLCPAQDYIEKMASGWESKLSKAKNKKAIARLASGRDWLNI
jgi:hypothetical protein